jgi:gamma-glutamyltranspeptidase / glutathione hydrolase
MVFQGMINLSFIIEEIHLMKTLKLFIVTKLFLFMLVPSVMAQSIISQLDRFSPVEAKNGMVATAEPIATQIGIDVLKRGGNAIDAAVTIGFVMAVTYPRAGNIGGGGFMLVYSAKTGQVVAIDYREMAPALASQDMFLDSEGNLDTQRSQFSHQSTGVPGTVAGLAWALEKYGTLSLAEALAPAIQLAEQGFVITPQLSRTLKSRAHIFELWAASRAIFLKPNGEFYEAGDQLFQKDLAKTLKMIAEQGIEAFYQGEIAERIVKEMKTHGGLISRADLANYRPAIRHPVHGVYRGYDIYSMSPPSSGGVHIVQMLNLLEPYNISELGHNSAATIHLMTEAMKRAFADRSKYLADPKFFPVPTDGLIAKDYANLLRMGIDPTKAIASQDIFPGPPPGYESHETTHFSVVDKAGNAVSNTYTLNFSFGSGIVVPGTGFLLNNEMDDFTSKPGEPNGFGLIGSVANIIEPKKRMLSSMSPTMVLKEGKPFIVTGTPGGSMIITVTLQVIMNVIDHKMNIQEAVNASRIHHQWLPDELGVEEGLTEDTLQRLKNMGHNVVLKSSMGAASSILIDQERKVFYGAADPRRTGFALGY